MSDGSSYPARVTDDNSQTRFDGTLTFSDSTNQPAPSSNSIISGTALAVSGLTGSTVASRYVGQVASGSPGSGAHLLGDFVTTTAGQIYVCSVAGTPGTWVEIVAGSLEALALTNAMVSASAAIAVSKLADPTTGKVIGSAGSAAAAVFPPGFEVTYDQITSPVNVAATSEGAPTTIITGTSKTYEAVPYMAEFFSPSVADPSSAVGIVTMLFIADGASIGRIAVSESVTATTQTVIPTTGRLRFTPTAAAHTYGIAAFCSATTGTPAVGAGAGGINTLAPAFLRITKV